MYEDQPDSFNVQEFAKMMLAGSGLGHDIVGTDESIKGIKQENFRRFIKRWYYPENMLLVVAGKKSVVQANDLGSKVTSLFDFSQARTPGKQQKYWEKDFQYGRKLNIIDRQTEQSHFIMAWPGLTRFDERRYALGLLQTILGGNMSSRLFSEVRERRGLCYYVHSVAEQFCDAGYFGAASGVNPGKLTEAIRVTINEFQALASSEKPITPAELQRAKDFRCGQVTLASEAVYNMAITYGFDYLFDKKITTVAEGLKKIQAVSLEEVQTLAQELITSGQLRLGVIGQLSPTQRNEVEQMVKTA